MERDMLWPLPVTVMFFMLMLWACTATTASAPLTVTVLAKETAAWLPTAEMNMPAMPAVPLSMVFWTGLDSLTLEAVKAPGMAVTLTVPFTLMLRVTLPLPIMEMSKFAGVGRLKRPKLLLVAPVLPVTVTGPFTA